MKLLRCSHSSRGHDDAPCLYQYHPVFPPRTNPTAIYKGIRTADAWTSLGLHDLARHELAYLSDLMWPLAPETLSSSHTGFSHKAVLCGVVPSCSAWLFHLARPVLGSPALSTISLVCCSYAYTYYVQLSVFLPN